jgi:hypothetical protein
MVVVPENIAKVVRAPRKQETSETVSAAADVF